MAKKNPAAEIDELREEVADLNARLDRVSGLTELADAVESEEGLRTALDRIASIVDGEDAEDFDCENCEDEGCAECDPDNFEDGD
jgi:hypothetical protein